ncbi:MAG: hypothetical protein HC852_22985 [Acaryochloridaceae cyanobacterium RU_4_10]|nr:hypothetical protein [Acaryochloridaceae cyanobacterium RU_4_10]
MNQIFKTYLPKLKRYAKRQARSLSWGRMYSLRMYNARYGRWTAFS